MLQEEGVSENEGVMMHEVREERTQGPDCGRRRPQKQSECYFKRGKKPDGGS